MGKIKPLVENPINPLKMFPSKNPILSYSRNMNKSLGLCKYIQKTLKFQILEELFSESMNIYGMKSIHNNKYFNKLKKQYG